MRPTHHGVFARAGRALGRSRTPFALGVTAALVAIAGRADAQVGSANVPLPNVLLLLDTSGSFEHMIDGSNPEDTTASAYNLNSYGNNNTVLQQYANCETAWQAGVPALPNRWGVAVQALTGTVLNGQGSAPFYSCVTMDRVTGPLPGAGVLSTSVGSGNGEDLQYGLRDETGFFFTPYDSGYYLPFHRPVSQTAGGGRCVYSPNVLPGATLGGVGLSGGMPSTTDCPNEPSSVCLPTDYPTDAIGTFLYDRYPTWDGTIPSILPTPNFGYSSNTQSCTFNQATDGIIDQASTLVRFGLMTFDNDPNQGIGVQNTAPMSLIPSPASPFTGQWSYFSTWDAQCAAVAVAPPSPYFAPSQGWPAGCNTPAPFVVGARNPAAPPWEGRLLGFPNPDADVNATGQSNLQVQAAINSLRPYGATPTAGLMAGAEYYFWGDPTGPSKYNTVTPDPFVAGGCRSQYIILLTDGAPNLDLRPACQSPTATTQGTVAGGLCPYALPEDTASVLATGASDKFTGLNPGPNGNVYTYVIGFAVSGNEQGPDTGSANCAQLAANGTLASMCQTGTPYSQFDNSNAPIAPLPNQQTPGQQVLPTGTPQESPCCSLQRIAVAGGTQHAYFADTPGDLNAALAAVLGDITGQLGSRTLPVASPTISYAAGGPLTASYISTFSAAACPPGNQRADGTCSGPWQSNGPWTGDIARQQYVCPGGGVGAQPLTPGIPSDDFGALTTQGDLYIQNTSGSRNFLFFNGVNNGGTTSTNALTIRPYLNTTHLITNNLGAAPPLDNLDTFGNNGQTGAEVANFGQGSVSSIYTALGINNGVALNIQASSCQDPYSAGYLDQQSCANLALSFAMAQSSFPSTGASTAANLLSTAYSPTGLDGPNHVQPTNRAATPLGAILDSTPAVIAVPSAQVRDDSYQAFSTALSAAVLTKSGQPTRDTMMYVASVDGLLHAFDTAAGISPTVPPGNVESWAFIPPAVMPHLISNYPGASNILLDGTPVVKDVVFSRCENSGSICGSPPSAQWVQDWHTMLVGGFGLGGRGYYALDVTDPRPPPSPVTPNFSATNYPTYVSTGSPGVLTGAGPHFQWQITSTNLTGTTTLNAAPSSFTPNEWFGKVSGTPAITTVYADPTVPTPGSPTSPQEIGVAILPGGRDGLPIAAGACSRELLTNPTAYKTAATLYTANGGSGAANGLGLSPFNLSDSKFPPRANVRQWAQNCLTPAANAPQGSAANTAVAGRTVMVVSIATGQVLAVFARAPSQYFLSHPSDATSWDVPTDGQGHTLIGDGTLPGQNAFLNATPLDSPMTGTPVVYPSGVGVVAQAAYIGDADGTMWRFDLSDPNPRNWTGAIFTDAYSPIADTSGGDTYPVTTTDWTAMDSEGISVEPQLALDSSASLVMNFATGDQTAFNPCYSVTGSTGSNATISQTCTAPLQPTVNFIYSVREARGTGSTPYQAQVNWYKEWTTGERVTGPMAIFNGILYFATYLPPGVGAGNTLSCAGGGANLYAWDFTHVAAGCSGATGDSGLPVGCGGIGTLDQNFLPSGELNFTSLQVLNPAILANTIIPGVSIASTPSCTTATNAGVPDAYTGGTHTSVTPPVPGTYSLMANIGKGKKTTAQNLITQPLQAPHSPTIVDSWAGISE